MVNYHTLFSQIGAESSVKKKVEMLQDADTPNLRALLRAAYDKRITWSVPDTKPPYEVNDTEDWEDVPMKLYNEIMKVGRFAIFDGNPTNQSRGLTRMQRESQFIGVLAGLHKTEADILANVLKRKINYKGVTPRLAEQAFPELLPDE